MNELLINLFKYNYDQAITHLYKVFDGLNLPPKTKETFRLIIFEGYSQTNAMKLTGASKSTYYKYQDRVVAALKPIFDRYRVNII